MRLIPGVTDDQILFNTALERAGITWTPYTETLRPSSNASLNTGWTGHAPSGLKVTLLPLGVACRGEGCQRGVRGEAYIWHRGRNRHKIETMSEKAEQDGVWFLKEAWSREEGAGLELLRRISTL